MQKFENALNLETIQSSALKMISTEIYFAITLAFSLSPACYKFPRDLLRILWALVAFPFELGLHINLQPTHKLMFCAIWTYLQLYN
jgi:hypothetical protein